MYLNKNNPEFVDLKGNIRAHLVRSAGLLLLTALCCAVLVEFYITVGAGEARWARANVRLSVLFTLSSVSTWAGATGGLLSRAESTCKQTRKH